MAREKLDLLQETFDEVLDALKHLDDKIGRLLTSVAFLTAATLALASLKTAKFLGLDFDLQPVKLPLALISITVFLLGIFVTVILLLAGLAAPLGVPGVTSTPATDVTAGMNSGAQGRTGGLISQLWFMEIAAATPKEWEDQWNKKCEACLERDRVADLIRESQHLARRTVFKADRISEAVAVLSFSILAFAVAVVFTAAAMSTRKDTGPVPLDYSYRIAIGVLFGVYFFMQLAIPARHARQSLTPGGEGRIKENHLTWKTIFASTSSLMIALILVYERPELPTLPWAVGVILLALGSLISFIMSTNEKSRGMRAIKIVVMVVIIGGLCGAVVWFGVRGVHGYYIVQLACVVSAAFALLVSSLLSPTLALQRRKRRPGGIGQP